MCTFHHPLSSQRPSWFPPPPLMTIFPIDPAPFTCPPSSVRSSVRTAGSSVIYTRSETACPSSPTYPSECRLSAIHPLQEDSNDHTQHYSGYAPNSFRGTSKLSNSFCRNPSLPTSSHVPPPHLCRLMCNPVLWFPPCAPLASRSVLKSNVPSLPTRSWRWTNHG